MARFYRAHLEDGLSPAAALRRAQQELAKGRFRDPYFWAAFVLLGDWRSSAKKGEIPGALATGLP